MGRPEVRWTSSVLLGGTLLSAAVLVVGVVLGLTGREAGAQQPLELAAVLRASLDLRPWGWSMLGVLILLATPAAGLVASFFETRRAEPRSALLALAVLGILVGAAVGAGLIG
jgi:uncharacterized membrane protein